MEGFLESRGFPKDAVRYEFHSLEKPPPKRAPKMFDREELDEIEEPLETFDAAAPARRPELENRPFGRRPQESRGNPRGDSRPPRRGPRPPGRAGGFNRPRGQR